MTAAPSLTAHWFDGQQGAAHAVEVRLQGGSLQQALAQGCAAACLCVEAAGGRGGIATLSQLLHVQSNRPLLAQRGLA